MQVNRKNSPSTQCTVRALMCLLAMSLTVVGSELGSAVGQEFVTESQWKRGYHGLSMICRSMELEVQNDFAEWSQVSPRQSLLIVLGSDGQSPDGISNFIRQGGAVLFATDRNDLDSLRPFGLTFLSQGWRVRNSSDAFRGHRDCPIVKPSQNGAHPVVRDVRQIITNRPALISGRVNWNRRGLNTQTVASLPRLLNQSRTSSFMIALETRSGGKAICLADQSVFSNQMLIYGDNARLAIQALAWLRDTDRTNVLMIADGQVTSPYAPSSVDVLMPPPSRKEVFDALKQLPPDVFIEFGNAVATVVEDEAIVNDLVESQLSEMRGNIFNRWLILIVTSILGFVAVYTFMSHKGTEDSFGAQKPSSRHRKNRAATERKLAAELLMERFCNRIAGRSFANWQSFPQGITITGSTVSSRYIERAMNVVNQRLRSQQPTCWTKRRLAKLESDVDLWHHLCTRCEMGYEQAVVESVE